MDYTNLGIQTPTTFLGTGGLSTTISNVSPTFSSVANVFLSPTIRAYTLDSNNRATEGFLTGRRPVSGQLYPRGVYNK